MNDAHRNTVVTQTILAPAIAWLTDLAGKKTVDGEPTPKMVALAVVNTIGLNPTYGTFADMSAADLRLELVTLGARLPRNVEPVIQAFLQTWGPHTSACDSCHLPAITACADMRGIDVAADMTPCPLCDHGTVTPTAAVATSFMSWVTGREVPGGTLHDVSTGTKIPIAEEELVRAMNAQTVTFLRQGHVAATVWASYLLHGRGAAAFGVAVQGPESAGAVMALLRRDVVTDFGDGLVKRQIALAAQAIPTTREVRGAQDRTESSSSNTLLDRLNGLLEAQFNTLVFRLGIPLGILSGASAPQATRAIEVVRWATANRRLDDVGQAINQVTGFNPAKKIERETVRQVHAAAMRAGLADSRRALLGGMDTVFVQSLNTTSAPAAQMLLDLGEINGVAIAGESMMACWLRAALALVGPRAEAGVFQAALEELGTR